MVNTLIDILALALAIMASLIMFAAQGILGLGIPRRVIGFSLGFALLILSGVLYLAHYYGWQTAAILTAVGGLFLPFLLLAYTAGLWMLRGMIGFSGARVHIYPPGWFREAHQRVVKHSRQYVGLEPVPLKALEQHHPILTAVVLSTMFIGTVLGSYGGLRQSALIAALTFAALARLFVSTASKLDIPNRVPKWNVLWAFSVVWLTVLIGITSSAVRP
jgi:hypothetical protein